MRSTATIRPKRHAFSALRASPSIQSSDSKFGGSDALNATVDADAHGDANRLPTSTTLGDGRADCKVKVRRVRDIVIAIGTLEAHAVTR